MKFKEYQNRTLYILVDANKNAILRPDAKDQYKTEAVSPIKAKAQILHQMRSGKRGKIEWDVIKYPDEYHVMPFDDWYAIKMKAMDAELAKRPPEPIPPRKKNPSQSELFSPQRWHQ